MLVAKLTTRFLNDIKDRRAPATYEFYKGRLVYFERFFKRRDIRSLKKRDIKKYFEKYNNWPDGTPKAPDTIRANIAAFQQLQKFAIKKGKLKKPILDDIDKPAGRNRETLPSEAEVIDIKRISSKRFCLAYEALRRSGARPMELVQATVEMWDRNERQLIIKEHKTARKTGVPRRIHVGEVLEAIILESLDGRTTGPLFLTPTGLQWTVPSLSAAFRLARNALGLNKEIVLYTSRHEHATAVYDATGSELAAAKSLGHKGLASIPLYVKIRGEKRRETQDAIKMGPVAVPREKSNDDRDQEAANPASTPQPDSGVLAVPTVSVCAVQDVEPEAAPAGDDRAQPVSGG